MRKNVFNKGNRNKLCDVDRADAFVLTNLNLLCVSNLGGSIKRIETVIFDSQIYKM